MDGEETFIAPGGFSREMELDVQLQVGWQIGLEEMHQEIIGMEYCNTWDIVNVFLGSISQRQAKYFDTSLWRRESR